MSKFEHSRIEVKNLKSEIATLKSDKNSLSVACKTSRKEITELVKKFEKEKELLELKVVDLSTFKKEIKAKEREEILKNRKAAKKSKKEFKVKAVAASLENDTIDEKNEKICVDVVTNNRFDALTDINHNNEEQAHHHPAPRIECKSSNEKKTLSVASGFTSTARTSSSSTITTAAVTSSSSTSDQERIQCDQCSRKCVGKRDMEHHIWLWHTDRETQILMSRKKTETSDP